MTHYGELIAAALVAASLLAVWLSMPYNFQLCVLVVVCIGQVFIPQLPIVTGAFLLVVTTCAQRANLRSGNTVSALLFALAGISILSLAWSPDPVLGRADISYFIVLGLLVVLGAECRSHGVALEPVFVTFAIASLIESVMVVLFRLSPTLERLFLQSGTARILINPSSLDTLFTSSPNNVLDPAKAGGLFLNANAASAMMGVALVITVGLYFHTGKRILMFVALVHLFGVIAAGSKTGMALLVVSVVLGGLVAWRRLFVLRIVVPTFSVIALLAFMLTVKTPDAAPSSLDAREFLWSNAVATLRMHPLEGVGFGGWTRIEARFSSAVGSGASYPPHNLFLNTWLNSGVIAVLMLGSILWIIWNRLVARLAAEPFAGTLLVGFAWTVIHSMGDNTSLFNDLHTAPVLAIGVGFVLTKGSLRDESSSADGVRVSPGFVQDQRTVYLRSG